MNCCREKFSTLPYPHEFLKHPEEFLVELRRNLQKVQQPVMHKIKEMEFTLGDFA